MVHSKTSKNQVVLEGDSSGTGDDQAGRRTASVDVQARGCVPN